MSYPYIVLGNRYSSNSACSLVKQKKGWKLRFPQGWANEIWFSDAPSIDPSGGPFMAKGEIVEGVLFEEDSTKKKVRFEILDIDIKNLVLKIKILERS